MKPIQLSTITQLIDLAGGIETFTHIRIENKGYMPLVLERIGDFDGMPLISVAHYYSQNGDPMRDPEMTFAISYFMDFPSGKLTPHYHPVSFQQDGVSWNGYHVAMFHEGEKSMVRTAIYNDLKSFARTWNKNLRDQGFILAAQALLAAEKAIDAPTAAEPRDEMRERMAAYIADIKATCSQECCDGSHDTCTKHGCKCECHREMSELAEPRAFAFDPGYIAYGD